jgi:hypothetical protein
VLTSTSKGLAIAAVVLQTMEASLRITAALPTAFKRHNKAPTASAAAEKPLPSTVNGAPPWATPRAGHTDEMAAAGPYVNPTPLCENWCPFIDTSIMRSPAAKDGGAVHSS